MIKVRKRPQYCNTLLPIASVLWLALQGCTVGGDGPPGPPAPDAGPEPLGKETGFIGGFVAARTSRLAFSTTPSPPQPFSVAEGELWLQAVTTAEGLRILHFDMKRSNPTPHLPVKDFRVPLAGKGKTILTYAQQQLYLWDSPTKTIYSVNALTGQVNNAVVTDPQLGGHIFQAKVLDNALYVRSGEPTADSTDPSNFSIYDLSTGKFVSSKVVGSSFLVEDHWLLQYSEYPYPKRLEIYDLAMPTVPTLVQTFEPPMGYNRIYEYYTHISSDYLCIQFQDLSSSQKEKTRIFQWNREQKQFGSPFDLTSFGCDGILGDVIIVTGIGSSEAATFQQVGPEGTVPHVIATTGCSPFGTEQSKDFITCNDIKGRLYGAAIDSESLKHKNLETKLLVNTPPGRAGLSFFHIVGSRVIVDPATDQQSTLVFGPDVPPQSKGNIVCDTANDGEDQSACFETLTGPYQDYFINGIPYEPKYPLYSDGAEKARALYLPPGQTIDTSDPDGWVFPVGTKAWKEFRSPTTPGGPASAYEIRTFEKFQPGAGADKWKAAVFVRDGISITWGKRDPNDATILRSQATHDAKVPHVGMCNTCHGAAKDKLLGFDAVDLSGQPGSASLAALATRGLLSTPAPQPAEIQGSEKAKAALGYMHNNCGTCHHPQGPAASTGLFFRHSNTATSLQTENAYKTLTAGPTPRVVAKNPAGSIVFQRVTSTTAPMPPPLLNQKLDPAIKTLFQNWINEL